MDQDSANNAVDSDLSDLNRSTSPPSLINLGVFSFLDSVLNRLPSSNNAPARRQVINPYTMRVASFRPHAALSEEPRSSSAMDTSSENTEEPIEPPPTDDVEAGGFRDSIFLYLSEKEKEDFSCCICYLIMNKVYQCRNEHRFCYGCIYTWSCGSGQGHDRCPMCRVDGLYAMNKKMTDKIQNKCVTCENDGCNWLGILCDYDKHEHRYYTPSEFQVLTMFRAKNAALNLGLEPSVEPSLRRDRDIALSGPLDSEAFINSRFSLQNTVRRSPVSNSSQRSRLTAGRYNASQPLSQESADASDPQWTAPRVRDSDQEEEGSELVYKRLVPSNWQVACEQLRETREQLAAMLTLMTMELEERRSQLVTDTQRPSQTLPSLVQHQRSQVDSHLPTESIMRQSHSSSFRRSEPMQSNVRFSGIFTDLASPSMQRARTTLMTDLFDQVGSTRPRRGTLPDVVEPSDVMRTRHRNLPRLNPLHFSAEVPMSTGNSPLSNSSTIRPVLEIECLRQSLDGSADIRQSFTSNTSDADSDDVTISTDLFDYSRDIGDID